MIGNCFCSSSQAVTCLRHCADDRQRPQRADAQLACCRESLLAATVAAMRATSAFRVSPSSPSLPIHIAAGSCSQQAAAAAASSSSAWVAANQKANHFGGQKVPYFPLLLPF
ncbi:hypothetical protein PGQ11_009584 [Apiospora arundinis]|uniref:Uncharacterized protein n=1 Tax=Apiospora arundinis TaxID=335852 RepID=A0ABR2IJA7_9PEZI